MSNFPFNKVAIVGATGPTGMRLVSDLVSMEVSVRVISRSAANLAEKFPGPNIEKAEADAAKGGKPLRLAIEGCDLVFDCIGLPPSMMELHPVAARNLVGAMSESKARCVKVTSFWSYLPATVLPMNESHPREGGPPWVRWRREAEDVLLEGGAAIAHLPDFFGPHVHASAVQQPLREAQQGKKMNWIGRADTPHEYAYIPDAIATVLRLAASEAAYGKHWILPGSGPITGADLATIASRHLNRSVGIRSAGPLMLKMVSFFSADLRGFMQMVPEYLKPIRYDASALRAVLGDIQLTPYEEAIGETVRWLIRTAVTK